jgi:putative tryptophan/tyrosine transport system substrate-binding protein
VARQSLGRSPRAQQDAIKRVGVLMAFDEHDARAKGWLSSFTQGLSELGWAEGRNLQMEVRWAGDNVDRMRMFAKELVELRPDVIVNQERVNHGRFYISLSPS